MSALDASSAVCTVCGEVATTFCAGCASDKTIEDFAPTPTHYCGKGCQTAHWASHKKSCQAVQAKVKLFRAGLLLQQMFLAGRAEAHDLSIARLERAQNGGIHIFDQPSQVGIRPLSSTLTNDENTKNAVLSYGAGDDVYSGLMFELCKRALKGYATKVEEVDLRVFTSRLLVARHFAHNKHAGALGPKHSVVRVTLRDNSVWVFDPSGAQHGQFKPVMLFDDYDRGYIAKILDSRLLGKQRRPFTHRRSSGTILVYSLWDQIQIYQSDELAEWEHHNIAVQDLIKAKTDDFLKLKQALIEHVATAAREYVKRIVGDPTSKARPIHIRTTGTENMSEDDKARMERKMVRKVATMDPTTRALWEKGQADGNSYMMMIC